MAYIEVNPIFDELKKCLNTLIEFKTFVDLISHKFRYELDSNELQKYLPKYPHEKIILGNTPLFSELHYSLNCKTSSIAT